MPKDSGTLVLRNYPDDDALKHPEKYSKALSFSPDIIPLYGTKADQSTLANPASWRGFTGMPIVGGDVNHVYIRGYGSGGPYIASLRVVPSELILWPQVWSTVDPVSSGPVVIPGGDAVGPYVSNSPLQFRPPHTTGNAYSLIANVFKHDSVNEHKSLQEYEPIPSFDPQHFDVDDFLSFVSKDNTFTFYNVVVADPTLKHVSANTRLRLYSKSPVPVIFRLDWHKGTPVPAGLEVSLIDDRGKITIPRTPLLSLGEHKVLLEPSYDGILTLNIFSPAGNAFFEPYSGLSIQVLKSEILGSTLQAAAHDLKPPPTPLNPPQLLGALNVIFDPHSTRNLRFASPSATQLRESKNYSVKPGHGDCTAIPTTTPAATGWWFRAQVNDTNNFPHTAPGGYSPDIQPIGTDLTASGLWNSLQNPSADYSKDHSIELVGNKNNYVFVRGHSTIADVDVQSRIFAITGSPILHPSQYTTQSIPVNVFGGDGTIDQQGISVENSNQFYLFTRPFDIKAPPNPNPGSSPGGDWMAKPHYCIIAEVRQKRKCSLVFPSWPSEQVEDFKTLQDFQHWCSSCPLVCYRNMGWEPYKPGKENLTWSCSTQLIIPDGSFYSSFWTIIVECDNPIIPPGSKWTLTFNDNEVFPNGLCFKDLPISTQAPAYAGCHFTGATPGRAPSTLTLTVTWGDNGSNIPPPGVKIRLATTEVATSSPVSYIGEDPPPGSETWPFYVGSKYPYIGLQANPSPLPTFGNAGVNTWPYPDSPQFVLGQVALAAQRE